MSQLSITAVIFKLLNKNKPMTLNKDQFSSWLTGFIDGEGNFQVYIDRGYLRVMFRIRLHIDDKNTLIKIKQILRVGKIRTEGNSCVFIISEVTDLLTVLFPILDKYNLCTTKWLDYLYFKSIVLILSNLKTTKLSIPNLKLVKDMISKLNLGRKTFNYDLIPKVVISPFWLLGFIEDEGKFGFNNLSPYFQIGQNKKNLRVLNAIEIFIKSLPKIFKLNSKNIFYKKSKNTNKNTSVSVIVITNIDTLYDFLLFFLLDMPFQTRKVEDFYYWSLALYLHNFAYFYMSKGRLLVYKIYIYVNKYRYSTNINSVLPPSFPEIEAVLNLNLPITLQSDM